MLQTTKILGNQGEQLVSDWLEQQQFTILARNFQTRLGEVDIIASKADVVAFVEVKTRNVEYFPISQTVTFAKQQRIIKAAKQFILTNQLRDKVFRFDVATVNYEKSRHKIDYIPNAFQARY